MGSYGHHDATGQAYPKADANDQSACLVLGADSLILTPRGPVSARVLRDSDLVLTRDRGYQPLRFVARLQRAIPSLLLAASAVGVDQPAHPLSLSENAQIWPVGAPDHGRQCARDLLDIGAVHEIRAAARVVLLLDQPDGVYASGLWVSCPHPSDAALRNLAGRLSATDRMRLFNAFPVAPLFDSRKARRHVVVKREKQQLH